ncbi:hypothetical protein ElyMa_001803500 [Elysia marginata]|uniref:Uncharacterized protein n=1 Tax=Elysia marginata TaxID=1093978 RepID=A0AAV4EHI0_9GAST|nr:hypothetical protein ElyMa_001803500 [Elysia marginata]
MMNVSEEGVQQKDVSPKIPLSAWNCMDCDDVAPSWALTSPSGAEYQNSVHYKSFPLKSSVVSGSDGFKRAFTVLKTKRDDYPESESVVQHGFSFGRRSFSQDHTSSLGSGYLRGMWRMGSIEDEDDDAGELYVTDIYRSTGDIPGALLYKTETERRAVSQKIGSIGRAGQNISLGHILGKVGDDSLLIPSCLKLIDTSFVLDVTSPTQTDIKWCPASNASQFRQLVYEVEFCDITSQRCESEGLAWCFVGRVHHPVIRVYRTDSSLLLGRHRLKQTGHDTLYKLRVRALGRVMSRTGPVQMWMGRSQSGHELSHSLAGEWSSDIYLTWVGWDNQKYTKQITSL